MKILITTDWYNTAINGVVTSVINLENELRNKGHEVKILTLSEDFHPRCEGNVYYVPSINMNKIYPNARASIFLHKEYIEEIIMCNPDIVHSQCEFTTFIYAKKIAETLDIPIVHTYHTIYEDYTHYISPSKTIGRKAVATLSKKILRNVQAVIAPTEKVSNLLKEYGVEREVYTIPTGIDLKKFNITLSNKQKEKMKKEFGIPENNVILLSVGRLAKEKKIDEIIKYINMIKRENISMLIVGDGPYRNKLEKEVQELNLGNKVIFAGMISPEEVPSYYQLGDIFISASNSETQGLTYLEALASGLPSVCKSDPCIKDVIINGYNGFQYDSFESFENHINYINDNKEIYGSLSENARLTAEKYTTGLFADKVESLYERVIYEYSNSSQIDKEA